jgi:hypothetical protein
MKRVNDRPAIPLDYATGDLEIGTGFRFGVIVLTVSILSTLISLGTALATNHGISGSLVNTLLQGASTTSAAAFTIGIPALFQRRGRHLTIVGVIISGGNMIFIPAFMVA